MSTLLEEFRAITSALDETGIDYAICGGWAMAVHGLPRATLDIDLLILADDLSDVWAAAQSLEYDVEGLPLHFADGAVEIRRISKVDQESKRLFTIDLLLVTEPLQDVWQTREHMSWDEGKIWVVSKDGLIKLKTISGREQDLLDIRNLQGANNEG